MFPKSRQWVFDAFDTFGERQANGLMQAKALAQKFVADVLMSPWDGPQYCLTFAGKSGTGKTFLAKCAYYALRPNGWAKSDAIGPRMRPGKIEHFTMRQFGWREVSRRLKEQQYGLVDGMIEPHVLLLDDIGADYDPKSYAASVLDEVLRARAGKWTLATLNFSLQSAAAEKDARIASFLVRDFNIFQEVQTVDYALRKNKGRIPPQP